MKEESLNKLVGIEGIRLFVVGKEKPYTCKILQVKDGECRIKDKFGTKVNITCESVSHVEEPEKKQ